MRLLGDKGCIRTRKAFTCLVEKACAFEFIPSQFHYGNPDICSMSALPGRVYEPILIEDDASFVGAMAICARIEERFPEPALMPRDSVSRMRAIYIEEFFYAQMDELVQMIAKHEAGELGSNPEIGAGMVQGRLRPIMEYLEKLRAKSSDRYLCSSQICIADVSIGTALMHLSKHAWYDTSGRGLDPSTMTKLAPDFPLMTRYCNELWRRQSFQAAKEISSLWKDTPVQVSADGMLSAAPNSKRLLPSSSIG